MDYVLLDQLSLDQQNCKIKIRLSRVWDSTIPQMKNQILSLECLLIDEKGNSLQATIRKHDAEHFKQKLSEGSIYAIENFNVVPSRAKYKVVNHKYMIQINKWTNIVEVADDSVSIPHHIFSFSSFADIRDKKYEDGCLLDVIGSIAAISPIYYSYVGEELTPLRNMEIQDAVFDTFSVTLWDKFALNFDDRHIHDNKFAGSVIVIFASMSTRIYKEKLQLSTCSSSRFYINLDIPAVAAFREALQRSKLPIGPIQSIEVAEQASLSPYEQMSANRKTIIELLKLHPADNLNTKYTCEAKLADIDTTYGWWYKACSNCKGGVKYYDDTFWCGQCGKNDHAPIPWYKLDAIVHDDTGSTNFMIFGKLAQELIRIPAQQLATATNSDRFALPYAIRNILEKTYIFQVVVDSRRFNMNMQSFKVSKIFHSERAVKIKTEEKESEETEEIELNTVDAYMRSNQKQSQSELVDKPSGSKITEPSSQSNAEARPKNPNTRKRTLRHIENSKLDKEDV